MSQVEPDDDLLDAEDSVKPALSRGRIIAAAAVGVVVLLMVALGAGWLVGRGTPDPTTSSAAAGFARDMQTHHEQAVDMAMTIYRSTEDPDVRQLAYDIATAQSNQAGQLYGILNEWGLPQASSDRPMAWMILPTVDGSNGSMSDHGMGTSADGVVPDRMPGLATTAQLDALRAATGAEADRIFLTLMIAHHQGGIAMEQAVVQRTTDPVILAFARAGITAQQSEISSMQDLLAARGGPISL